ncbi:MAG TPA: hypothetical protein VGF85_07525 [Opitutaceae bacterium]|jgi:azurin
MTALPRARRIASLFVALAALAAVRSDPNSTPTQPTPSPAPEAREVRVTMRDGLRFDPPRFAANPGEELMLVIENSDTTDLIHNFALVKPGTREDVVRQSLALAAQGAGQDYVPKSPDILAYCHLLATGSGAKVRFTMPPTPGVYPYVCTFPGHGMLMFGAIYSGLPMPEISKDRNIPSSSAQTLLAGGGRRPFTQRIFMPDAGPAAIAVALSGNQNFCWDAGECRLRYAWQGDFVDAAENWAGNGSVLAKVAGDYWWKAAKGDFPLRFGEPSSPRPEVKFLGYDTLADGPVFHYRAGGHDVHEQIVPRKGGPGLLLRFRVSSAEEPVYYLTGRDETGQWSSPEGALADGTYRAGPSPTIDFVLTLTSASCKP